MKERQDAMWEAERYRLEVDLGLRLGALFNRCPDLYGFLVGARVAAPGEADPDGAALELFIAGIDVYPVLGAKQAEALVSQISAELADLMNESPDAADLLAGRTFVRTLH
jgi:hypothetical protein